MSSPYPRACNYLRSIGIDPATVSTDGLTADGYYTLIRKPEFHRVWVEWPSRQVGLNVIFFKAVDEHEH